MSRRNREVNGSVIEGTSYMRMMIEGELLSQYDLESWIRNNCGLDTMKGQKRIVCVADKESVYKIAYNTDGMYGNCYEYLSALHIENLKKSGDISEEEAELFAKAWIVDGDPIIIRQEYGRMIPQDTEYQRWLRTNYPDDEGNPWLHVSEYVFEDPRLREDCNIIQKILSKYFVASDVHIMREPKNFGIKYVRGRDGREDRRLMLIDMDQCYPIVYDGKDPVVPTCPKCGSEMTYVPTVLHKNMVFGEVAQQTGVYSCLNERCANYTIDRFESSGYVAVTNDTRDTSVFADYVGELAAEFVVQDIALDCMYFIPSVYCGDIIAYKRAVENEVSPDVIKYWGNEGLVIAYRNYALSMMSSYLGMNADKILEKDQKGNDMDFYDYYDLMFDEIPANDDRDIYADKLIAYLYLQNKCRDDFGLFVDLVNSKDFKTFVDLATTILPKSDDPYLEKMFGMIISGF